MSSSPSQQPVTSPSIHSMSAGCPPNRSSSCIYGTRLAYHMRTWNKSWAPSYHALDLMLTWTAWPYPWFLQSGNHSLRPIGCSSYLEDDPSGNFQWLTGHINWALNIYLRMQQALFALYAKIMGKSQTFTSICINNDIHHELVWFTDHIKQFNGVHFFKSVIWSSSDTGHTTMVA